MDIPKANARLRRYLIPELMELGFSQRDIARAFGVDDSTIHKDRKRLRIEQPTDTIAGEVVQFYVELAILHQQVRELKNRNRNLDRKLRTCRNNRKYRMTAHQYKQLVKRTYRLVGRLNRKRQQEYEPEQDWGKEHALYIERLGLSRRTYNSLRRYGIRTIPELLAYDLPKIQSIPRIGKISLAELLDKVTDFCLNHPGDLGYTQ